MSITVSAAQRLSDFQKLVNEQQDNIRKAGNDAWNGISKGSEVHRVHEFLSSKTAGNSLLNREVSPLFHGTGWVVKFAAIFLHQKPYVRGFLPDDKTLLPKRCELGDLQTLFVYVRADKTAMRKRSVIFQAKMKPAIKKTFDVAHPMQRHVYDASPSFRYETVLAPQIRRLPTGLDRERALQYLFVAESPVTARTIPANKGKGSFVDYGEHLLRFLNDSTGLNVDTTKNADDWSIIVNDMIGEFNKAVQSGKSVPPSKYTRQQGLEGILNPFNSFESHDVVFLGPPQAAGKDGRGFGLQLVIVWDEKLGNNAIMNLISPIDRLRKLADEYDTSHKEHYKSFIAQRIELGRQISHLIRTEMIPFEKVGNDALNRKSQGMAAGLALALCEKPDEKAVGLLVDLLPVIRWKHVVKLVLTAIAECAGNEISKELYKQINKSVQELHAGDKHVQELLREIERRISR